MPGAIGYNFQVGWIIVDVWSELNGWYWCARGAMLSRGPFRSAWAAEASARRTIRAATRRSW